MRRGENDPDQELRQLIAEAHGAAKDLRQLRGELRLIIAKGVKDADQAARSAASEAIREFQVHLQKEMNLHAADLNKAVNTARQVVIKALTVSRLERTPEGKVSVIFEHNRHEVFDEDPKGSGDQ